ncbi:MAG: transporter [Marmoricola sp.]|nr:transporter [Marmoricola sp.]
MRLWTAVNVLSNAGTWMQMVAQNLLVLQLTGSAMMTGLSLSAQAAPGLLFGFLGGAIADKYPRRLVATVGQIALAAVAFVTASLAALDLLSVVVVMLLGVLSGVIATADGPACTLLGNELVPREDVSSAIAVGSVASNVGRLAGTALAGVTVAAAGISAAYVANGVSFLLVAACIPFLRSARRLDVVTVPGEAVEAASLADSSEVGVKNGMRYLTRDGTLLALVAVGAISNLLGRNYTMSMAALVTGPLQASASSYAQVGTALAAGGILGGILAGRLHSPRLGVVLLLAGTAAALQAVVGLSPVLLMVALVAMAMAAAEGAMATTAQTMLQTVPPEQLRGRVLGAWRTASTGWGLAGPPALGALLEVFGVRSGLVIGGAATVLLLGGVRLLSLRRRRTENADVLPLPVPTGTPVPAAA